MRGTGRDPVRFDLVQHAWELAGIVNVDPRPLTLRQLQAMVDGHQKVQWNHTLAIGLMFAQANGATGLSIAEFVPARYRGKKPKMTAEQEEANAELAFAELESGLKAWSASQGS